MHANPATNRIFPKARNTARWFGDELNLLEIEICDDTHRNKMKKLLGSSLIFNALYSIKKEYHTQKQEHRTETGQTDPDFLAVW